MAVVGCIESFANGDVGIVTQTPYNETVIKLNGRDFQKYLGELVAKAKKMGVYRCDCSKDVGSPTKSSKPIDKPNPKTHGGEECST